MVEPIFDYQFRLILIGDSTVGKSSLLKYFTDGKFAEVCEIVAFFSRFFDHFSPAFPLVFILITLHMVCIESHVKYEL